MAKFEPFTLGHFTEYAKRLVFDDGEQREPEDWQLGIAEDIFAGYGEIWALTPEGNGKSTFLAELCLYGADFSPEPWIPVGAAASLQAMIIFNQAKGFVDRTPGLKQRFKCLEGYKLIRSLRNGGVGVKIYAHDPNTGDGVIPFPWAFLDELHRHPDLRLYSLWKGKRRKRGAQLIASSTAGEPNSPFENQREQIRRKATVRKREGAYLRAEGGGLVLHEWMIQKEEDWRDMEKVADANPLKAITVPSLREEFESPTRDDNDFKRLKCNWPARTTDSAITDKEWDDAQVDAEPPEGAELLGGLDWAPKWDTTAFVGLWKTPEYRLLCHPIIVTPPRDGSLMHPDEVKGPLLDLATDFKLTTLAMDTSRAEDIASWAEDELGVTVLDWGTSNKFAVEDFNAFMEGLRNGTLKHNGDPELRTHVLNAVARRLPGGDHRFDRPSASRRSMTMQDRRVIDALTAAGMAVSLSNREKPRASVYEERSLTVA